MQFTQEQNMMISKFETSYIKTWYSIYLKILSFYSHIAKDRGRGDNLRISTVKVGTSSEGFVACIVTS